MALRRQRMAMSLLTLMSLGLRLRNQVQVAAFGTLATTLGRAATLLPTQHQPMT